MSMHREMLNRDASGQCLEHCDLSNARTYARTHKELLTLLDHLPLSNARRGVARISPPLDENEPAALASLDLASIITPPTGRFPVRRTRHTAQRQPIRPDDRAYVYERDHHACVRCGSQSRLTLDHIVPWSALGSDHVDNLRTLCWPCNEDRSNFHQPDDDWRPLPLTYCCVDCDIEFAREYPDSAPMPFDHPSMTKCFCWWHRHAAIGSRSLWFEENGAAWDYDTNWHRPAARHA